MRFGSPWWLVVGVLVVGALAAGAVVASRRRSAALAAAGLSGGRRRPTAGLWLSIGGLAVLALAVAGPAAAVPVTRAAGTVIVTVDVSNSMGADDVAPSRLAAAKQAAGAFIDAQPDSVDIGVVAFGNGALTTDRPSADHAAARTAVDRLSVAGGTSLANALLTSLSAITGKKVAIGKDGTVPDLGYWSSATIVLFSDGEDKGPNEATTAAAEAAQKAGVHVETVGVGTREGGTVTVDGFRIRTVLDSDTLTAVARTTGGSYHPVSDAAELNGIADGIDLRLTTTREDLPLAGAFTGLALLLLVAGAVRTVLRTGRLV
ncbi:MAG TPA: VWA domain-containing protein [Mycobacteriales bacterium]